MMRNVLIAALHRVVAEEDPFKSLESDDLNEEELEEVIDFMKKGGLVPDGKGPVTKPSTATPHDVAYDTQNDVHYLIVHQSHGGDLWVISDDGVGSFVTSFVGDYKAPAGVKIYKDGRYRDYMSLEAIRAIFDIVDPDWNKPASDDEREYLEELERKANKEKLN